MKLNNLKPAKGSVKNNKRVGRGQGSGREVLLREDTKVPSPGLDTPRSRALKAARCLSREECRNLASVILFA